MRYFAGASLFLLCFFMLLQPPQALSAETTGKTINVDKGDIVWSKQDDAGKQQIYFSSCRNKTSGWSTPVKITNDEYRNGGPVVDTEASGEKILVWTAGSDNHYILHYSIGQGNTWSAPASIPTKMSVNLAPSVVVDKSGATWAVWSANDGGQDEIYYAKYSQGTWSMPLQLNSANDVPDILPKISLNTEGRPQVVWQGYRNGSYVNLKSTWNGEKWTAETVIKTTSEDTTSTSSQSLIENVPSFVSDPETAFIRVYKSSPVNQ